MNSTSPSSPWDDRLKALVGLLKRARPADKAKLQDLKALFLKGRAAHRLADKLRQKTPGGLQ